MEYLDCATEAHATEAHATEVPESPSRAATATPFRRNDRTPHSTTADVDDEGPSIARDIEQAIRHLTRGGVDDLKICVTEDGVCLRGRCATYYCKQLAQEAAMKAANSTRLSNEIEVW